MLVANYNKLIGVRRRLLNLREYQLLDYLLNETKPLDPFSEEPSRRIELSELQGSTYVKAAYRDVTPRTFVRELVRLDSLGFINFTVNGTSTRAVIVEIDLGAIARYQIY